MNQQLHDMSVGQVQAQIRNCFEAKSQNQASAPLALKYQTNHSFTIRSKSYKNDCPSINCSNLNRIIKIDQNKRTAIVEPRVTMEELVQAAEAHGLAVPVVPEIKSMTVGGTIMGIGGETSSHQWGCFHDQCSHFEILCGNGELMHVDPLNNPDIFYGLPGSYGSLGMLVSAEIRLVPLKPYVHLRYQSFPRPGDAIDEIRRLIHAPSPPDYIEGLVFTNNLAVVVSGNGCCLEDHSAQIPRLKLNRIHSQWYYQHVYKALLNADEYEEVMGYSDYLFRHDRGAFWMGAYLLKPSVLFLSIFQGRLNLLKSPPEGFNEKQIKRFCGVLNPSMAARILMHPWMSCQKLSEILHQIDSWIQNRFIIQDFCFPEEKARDFLESTINDPGIFPIWLCPIKGTDSPQIFSPHRINSSHKSSHFINVGLYGLPSYAVSIPNLTRKLEMETKKLGGKKILYARTYYSEEEFWNIYPQQEYQALRHKTHAKGIWHEITDKVLSS